MPGVSTWLGRCCWREGVLGGSSTGTLVAAAIEYCREQTTPKHVVTFVCDSGNKYLSKMFNDYWMLEGGYVQLPHTGDLRDLFFRRYRDGGVISVGPEDSLLTAYNRMRTADVSQVPVLDDGKPVGILDESDLLMAVGEDEERFRLARTQRYDDALENAAAVRHDRIRERHPRTRDSLR